MFSMLNSLCRVCGFCATRGGLRSLCNTWVADLTLCNTHSTYCMHSVVCLGSPSMRGMHSCWRHCSRRVQSIQTAKSDVEVGHKVAYKELQAMTASDVSVSSYRAYIARSQSNVRLILIIRDHAWYHLVALYATGMES